VRLDLALIGWDDGPEPSPRLIARLDDADLVALARERAAQARRRELAELVGAVRPVEPDKRGGPTS